MWWSSAGGCVLHMPEFQGWSVLLSSRRGLMGLLASTKTAPPIGAASAGHRSSGAGGSGRGVPELFVVRDHLPLAPRPKIGAATVGEALTVTPTLGVLADIDVGAEAGIRRRDSGVGTGIFSVVSEYLSDQSECDGGQRHGRQGRECACAYRTQGNLQGEDAPSRQCVRWVVTNSAPWQ